MPILWAESFDHYGDDETQMTAGAWAAFGGHTLSNVRARTGTRSMRSGGGPTAALRRVLGAPYVNVGNGFAVYFESLPNNNDSVKVIEFRSAANEPQVTICVQSTGAIAAYTGDANPAVGGNPALILGTSTDLMVASSWNHLEVFCSCDSAVGTIEVRLNEVTILNLTNVNTDPRGTGEFSQVVTMSVGSTTGATRFFDDWIAWEADTSGGYNDDFIGDKKVFTQYPDADVNESGKDDWIPNVTGSEMYEMVDEAVADDDTTYIEALTIGDRAAMTFPDVHPDTIEIRAIILVHKTKKADAGTTFVQMSAENAGSEIAGQDRAITTLFTYYHDVFEVDPDTLVPWTPAGANSMAAILERTA